MDFFFFGQQTGFDDDFQKLTFAGGLHSGDFRSDGVPLAVLGPADVDDHVHFVRSVIYGIAGHEALGGSGIVAVGEADDGADGQFTIYIFLSLLDVRSGDTDGGGVVAQAVIADGLDFGPGGGLREQCVVALGENLGYVHCTLPPEFSLWP